MDALECLMKRRSVRKYKPDMVDEETIKKILACGSMAPSGKGTQSATMVVVRDPETIADLSRMNAAVKNFNYDPFFGAPMAVIVFSNPAVWPGTDWDAALMMGNLMNAAYAEGVSTCWINRGKQMFATEEGKAYMAKWGVPDTCEGVGICIMGYCDGEYPTPKARREDMIIWAD
ncbi:MAG: nitroreductase family protein [Lachnospiraceae bacterium]|nr:nitroreductase family protein [Lachnospiraceae bacterium]